MMLKILGVVTGIIGAVGVLITAGMWTYYEVSMIIYDPWLLIDPFAQLKIIWAWATTPIVWVGIVLITISSLRRHD